MARKLFALLLCALLMLTGCTPDSHREEKPFTVVATVFPAYDWVREIIADTGSIELHLLSGNGVDLHSYQATAEDMLLIYDCDLFLYVGGESDEWVEDVLRSVPNSNRRELSLMEALDGHLREEETVEGMQVRGFREEEEEYDEHVWLSVRNAAVLCEAIRDALCDLDPRNADTFRSNAEAYTGKLRQMDEAFVRTVSSGQQDTLMFCDRFPFRYLTEDYGLKYYAAFSGCSGDSSASFATVLFLAEKIDELGLHTVFTLEDSDGQLARTVVGCTRDKKQQILRLDSMQSVSLDDSRAGITYLSLMEANLQKLSQALN